jgi:CDP-diacylglycerol---glycerol-3-phosphate 3-phosphatidyltransferase
MPADPTDVMTAIDLFVAVALLALFAGAGVSYGVRLAFAGAPRFARVDAAGASPLLGKRLMVAGYWILQPVGRAMMSAGFSADAITRSSLALGLAAGAALAMGHLGVGGALAAVAALADVLDGLVARATGTASAQGGLLDATIDRYVEFFLVGGLAIHYHEDRLALALVLLALLGSFMVSYGSAKAEALAVAAPRGAMRRAERAVWICGGALLSPFAAALADSAGVDRALGEAPMLIALGTVALVANVSAVRRLSAVARAAGLASR